MTYRLAEPSDAKLYFDWANDPDVRMNAHNTEPIVWENHVKWFNKMVNSKALMLLFFEGETPVGQLRVDADGCIDLSVDPSHRKKGIATEMLTVLKKLQSKNFNVKGEVKQSNIPSNKAFERAGFTLESVVNIKGVDCNVFKI